MKSLLEIRAAMSIGTVFATRMLGLFMILPIFSVAAQPYPGANTATIGLALGIYGLTQACLQLPFGSLSDHWGRKPVITVGLLLFAGGSVVAAEAQTMQGLIIGRALQGAGAIGSTCIALLADLTDPAHRTRAMAWLGMSIGLAFALAMLLGPTLHSWVGLSGLFWLMAGLALAAILIVWSWVPRSPAISRTMPTHSTWQRLRTVLSHRHLWRLNAGIACSHATLTALFIKLPWLITVGVGTPSQKQWALYLPIMAASFVTMVPLIVLAEKKDRMHAMLLSGIGLMAAGVAGMAILPPERHGLILMMWLFFTGFNLLEAILPSSVSKAAPPHAKGAATGIYSTCQFLGIFVGGALGGWLGHHVGSIGLWAFMLILLTGWLIVARSQHDAS